MSASLEIVRFRIHATAAAFIATNAEVNAWLSRQPGFVRRTLASDPDGNWTDVVTWLSHVDALAAGEKFMAELGASPFMSMMVPETVSMSHAEIHLATS
jgi:hypothetical protein